MAERLRGLAVTVIALLVTLVPGSSRATQKFGPLQLSGNLQTLNLVRTPDASTYEYIMNRNVAHIRLDYDWLQGGKFYNKYNIPFIESSHLFLLYRGTYDSVYDTTPGFIQKEDIHGRAYGGLNLFQYAQLKGFGRGALELAGLPSDVRNGLKFTNELREAYIDLKFRELPLTVRAGRQQIVWGETDNFRMLDRANPLDLTWHFQQEIPAPPYGWDEIRRPLWMLKFLYDLGDVWKFSQSFLEWYWNPGDWYPAKQTFLPEPWGLPMLNPLTNPIDGSFIGGVCGTSKFTIRSGPNAGLNQCVTLMNGTTLFKQGNYDRNPLDNSQVGVRYHGIAPFGLEFTLNYFYQRFSGDDGTDYAPLKGLPKNPENNAISAKLLQEGIFPAEFIAPYVHTVGGSANYSDETFTQTVYRAETIFDFGIPFFDVAKETTIDRPALPGITNKNMWKGMIAFDRPTWIKSVNKKSTVFLTGQFFWHYVVDNPGCDAGIVANLSSKGKARAGSCLTGALDLPSSARLGLTESSPSNRDKIRNWETLFTLAAFTFYRGGSIVPVTGIAVDPTDQWVMEPFWTVDYVLRDDFVINLAQRYMVTPKGHSTPIFETWGLAGLNFGRSETELRLTYQF
jgi:hypothetical protein